MNGPVAGKKHAWRGFNPNGPHHNRDVQPGMTARDGTGPDSAVPVAPRSPRKSNFFGRLFDKIFRFRTDDPFGPRPTLRIWLKIHWGDILTLILLGAFSAGLLAWSPLPKFKYFAVYTDTNNQNITPGDELVNPQFAAPKMNQHVSIVQDAMIAIFVPFFIIWGTNMFAVHSFWDVNNACIGVVKSVMSACVVQIILKLLVVGLRPHFLTVCNPMTPQEAALMGIMPKGGFGDLYYNVDICRNKDAAKVANAMQSFPSGHSTAAWGGLFYLSLYVNGKYKPFSNYHPAWWKFLLFLFPMVLATLLVGSLTLDMSHNWYDIFAGSLIGTFIAALTYRMTFASIFDWRWNHVPLPRGNMYNLGGLKDRQLERGWVGSKSMATGYQNRGDGLSYSVEEMEMWSGLSATRQGGWRREGELTRFGAPGDTSAMSMFGGGRSRFTGDHRGPGRHGSHHRHEHGHGHSPPAQEVEAEPVVQPVEPRAY
jgi:membrane-associated phospholipid phosphatase